MRSISDEFFYGNNAAPWTVGVALTRSRSFQDISQTIMTIFARRLQTSREKFSTS